MIADAWAQEDLAGLASRGLLRTLEPLQSSQGAHVEIAGRALLNFSANDYLGLSADPRVAAAMAKCAENVGVGSGASRLVVGDHAEHRLLEAALAEFESAEAVRLFNSGYAANVGAIAALVGKEDAVFSDALNHASLVDGCRLSRATTQVFPHANVTALEALLGKTVARRKLVVTDSVFSMDGDVAPLRELVDVCERQGAALLVDEAHATGVLGERGAGACEAFGVSERVDIRIGTLGKAFGVYGAYAATRRSLADLFVQRARSLVFSTMLPPAVSAASRAALGILRAEPERRERLWDSIRFFAQGLRALGFPAVARSAIFPLVLGAPERAVQAAGFFRERGILVKAIRPPTVPAGTSRLRFALSAAHTRADLELALAVVSELRGKLT